jgi:hypothetical protein
VDLPAEVAGSGRRAARAREEASSLKSPSIESQFTS